MQPRNDLSAEEYIEVLLEEIRLLRYALSRAQADLQELRNKLDGY